MSATITIQGLDRLQAGVNAAPATLAREIRAGMVASSALVKATQVALAPRFSSETVNSIAATITATSASIGPSSPHAYYADQGRRPGKQPPIAAIEPWATAHGINAFVLARSIGRKGTRGKPFVAPSLSQNLSKIVAEFQKVGVAVVARMSGA